MNTATIMESSMLLISVLLLVRVETVGSKIEYIFIPRGP